jgi:polysaccharide biosynthesis/export protein
MKTDRSLLTSILIAALVCAANVRAQSGESPQPGEKAGAATEKAPAAQEEPAKKKPAERLAGDEPATTGGGAKTLSEAEQQALRREKQSEGEAGDLAYMNNWFQTYRLGPEDVITVDVFGLAQYSRANLIVPPDGKISYPLIGHIRVVGRTTEDLEKELTERLAEYIIDPKVSVQLVQARSQKVVVDGDVGKPGVYEMTRRMTVQEALAMAGPVLRTGSKTNVRLMRQQQGGERQLFTINLKELERGKGEDMYLVPGDIIIVPGNRFATVEKWLGMVTMAGWARMILR